MSPADSFQELAAGYVLGDLSSEEMEDFQRLREQHPELEALVASLQETLALLPQGLPPQMPAARVRSHLLQSAQAPTPPLPRRWLRWGAAGLAAVGCGLIGYRTAGLQLAQTAAPPAGTAAAAETTLVVRPAEALLSQQWSGLSQVLQDHLSSLGRPQGPVDVAATRLDALAAQLLTESLPALQAPEAMLVGGSRCQFGQVQGVRLTYRLPETTVSVYKIDLGEQFPQFPQTHVTLSYGSVHLLLWRHGDTLYALAAEVPLAELQTLAATLEAI